MSLSDRVTSITREQLVPMAVLTTLKGSPLVNNVLRRQKKFTGTQMQFPVDVLDTVDSGYFTGFDTLNTTPANDRRKLTFDYKSSYRPVTLSKVEMAINQSAGDNAVLNLVSTELQTAGQKYTQFLASEFYNSLGSGNTYLGLNAIVDDSTNANIYGGLSRTTYPTLKSTVTSLGGSLTLASLRQMIDSISDMGTRPDEIYTTYAVASQYESLLVAATRIDLTPTLGGKSGDIGYTDLAFKGIPIFRDKMCPTGEMFFINSEYLCFYAVPEYPEAESVQLNPGDKLEDAMYSGVQGFGFKWTGWIQGYNQEAYTGRIILLGELISNNPRRLGKLTDIV